jgi:hypothetical protein
MIHYNDGLICGVCKGEKVVKENVLKSEKVNICPKCNGTGHLSVGVNEQNNDKRQILKG